MSYVQYRQLFGSSKTEMANILPASVKSSQLLSGNKGEEGSKYRWEMTDGTFLEFELYKTKIKNQKWKTKYHIMSSSIAIHQELLADGSEMKDILSCQPITYCGCPFKQAILDRQAKELGNPAMNTQMTLLTWNTSLSKELTNEQKAKLKAYKIDQIDDLLTGIYGNKMAQEAKFAYEANRKYVETKNMPPAQAKAQQPGGDKAPQATFSWDIAQKMSSAYVERKHPQASKSSKERFPGMMSQSTQSQCPYNQSEDPDKMGIY